MEVYLDVQALDELVEYQWMGNGWWDGGVYLKFNLEACETTILGLLLLV